MADASSFSLLLSCLLATIGCVHGTTPFLMTWSDHSYGPDGPWQAVSVKLGSSSQEIALYPGGTWSSAILTTSICQNTSISSTCYADSAGLFNPNQSGSIENITDSSSWGSMNIGSVNGYGWENIAYDNMDLGASTTVPNVSLANIDQVYQTYPDGTNYPVEVGILSLGAPVLSHVWNPKSLMFITSWLYTSGGGKQTPSYSYGMHIGSAALNIAGSLLLGGFDQNRVLEEVSTQSYVPYGQTPGGSLPIGLLDIGLGVATGGSPWPFKNKTGLLTQGNSSIIAPLTLEVHAGNPYLYLPKSTCDAITAELPVVYQEKYGLYFWQTDNSSYSDIVKSPAYLAFSFQKNSLNNANITIKVPFALLNLTLKAPLVGTPTSYFPCFASNTTTYRIGRAFLQAAFIGVNWGTGSGTGNWFLAQAPGPGLVSNPTVKNINVNDATIEASQSTWEESWSGHWSPLPSNAASSGNTTTTTTSDSSGSGLSTGAKAGIGVGCAIGGLLIIAAIAWFFLGRNRTHEAPAETANGYDSVAQGPYTYSETEPIQAPSEMEGTAKPAELEDQQRVELESERPQQQHVYELGS